MANVMIAAFLLLTVAAAAAAAAPPWNGGCTEALISFSPCLSYVSSPPNNLTETASGSCCDAFTGGVKSLCFCYLLRDPRILGFPLNTTRLLCLSSVCSSNSTFSFDLLCSASTALPPLNGTAESISEGTSKEPQPGGTSRGTGAPFSLPPFDASSSTLSPHNSLLFLFSQLLAIFLALTLLNTVQ